MNPFVLYEIDFDAEIFQKYYGTIENPGIYAIPEDEIDSDVVVDDDSRIKKNSDMNQNYLKPSETESLDSKSDNKKNIEQEIQNIQQIPNLQLSQNDINSINQEIEPIKKYLKYF